MRRILVSAALVVVGLLVVPAVASASPRNGIEHFQLTRVDNRAGALIARGVFTASGIDYGRANTDLAVFPAGAFTIHHPNGSATERVKPGSCLVTVSFSGTYQINNGYGRFLGIAGFGVYHGTSVGVAPRNPDGTCSHRQPFSSVTEIAAFGPVSL